MLPRTIKQAISFTFAVGLSLSMAQESSAQIDFESAIFQNSGVLLNDSTGYTVTANLLEGGMIVGQLEAALTYGAGSNPFDSAGRAPDGSSYLLYAQSPTGVAGDETAEGTWDISVTPIAGWKVDGISIFSTTSTLGNPDFANVTTDGVGSVFDPTGLISNYNDGDSFNAQDNNLLFAGTATSGILPADHDRQWAFNSEGATQVSFDYRAGFDEPVATIAIEAINIGVQLSAVPEPATATISLLACSLLALRRRRK